MKFEEYEGIDISNDESLEHYGMPRRSGRYPWGSGDDPYQHGSSDFITRVEDCKKQGMSDKEIMAQMGMKSKEFRTKMSIAKNERKLYQINTAKTLSDRGLSVTEIAEKMNIPWSTAKNYVTTKESPDSVTKAESTAKLLKDEIDKKGFIDVGTQVERELGISKERLDQAKELIKRDGYNVYGGRLDQVTNPMQKTTFSVACGPKATYGDVFGVNGAIRTGNVKTITEYSSNDGGLTYGKSLPPKSVSSKRIYVRYAEDGGLDRDGTIEIRPGVKDLSLGNSRYAQVRIGVDDTHYLKGMALYSDNIPKGYDIVFNTNKSAGKKMMGFDPDGKPDASGVLKPMKKDSDNPFGVLLKLNGQSFYDDPKGEYTNSETGKKQSLSCINKLREEGDWSDYSRKLPSQFLAKQNISLVKNQLNEDILDKRAQYNDIKSLTNPTLKKYYLSEFAETCDKAAYQLKAAALPRQAYQVIIPTPNMKDNEIYAPNFKNGEKVALVRFPHGGTFEIPILKVNNNNPEAKKILGQAKDAVGINKTNADRLSGADFDGDTVLVIPTGKNKITDIKSTPQLAGLKGFDPKDSYGTSERVVKDKDGKDVYEYVSNETGLPIKVMTDTQKEMGIVSNLITDMTIRGASDSELARAVRHSMVVIDAEKHHLDYKKSEIDNDIASLKKDYQGHYDLEGNYKTGGASTLLSRAKGETSVIKRKGDPRINKIDPKTGKLAREDLEEGAQYWIDDPDAAYVDAKGNTKYRMQKSKQMLEVRDANLLSSGSSVETEYARYANTMKAMANDARKELIHTGNLKYDKNAQSIYKDEIKSLNEKVETALLNKPRERQAQVIATGQVNALIASNPELAKSKDKIKKIRQQAMNDARTAVGAGSRYVDKDGVIRERKIDISDREWDAIQAGAITETKLKVILDKADKDKLMQRALPRRNKEVSASVKERIKHYKAAGCTAAQIAEQLNMSTDTVRQYM